MATTPPTAHGSVEGGVSGRPMVTTGEAAYGPGSVDGSFELEVRDTTVKQRVNHQRELTDSRQVIDHNM